MSGTIIGLLWSSLNGTTIMLFLLTFLAYAWYRNVSRPVGFPQDQDYCHFLEAFIEPIYEVFNEIAKKYGDIFSLKFGSSWCVVLNNIDVAKEAYLKKPVDFAGRPKLFSMGLFSMGYKDIATSSFNETWQLQRKIAHAATRHFASGKEVEKLVHNVLPKLAQAIDAYEGKPFDPKDVLGFAVCNILAMACFGHEFSFDDPQLKRWVDFNTNFIRELGNGLPADFFPFLKYFPDRKTRRCIKRIREWTDGIAFEVKAHQKTYDRENIRDIIDYVMKAKEDARNEGSVKVDSLTHTHVLQTVNNMFSAGTEPATTTLHWYIALMAKYPDIQEKVAEEIDRVVGRDRLPSLSDRSKMPYNEAAINELLRYSSFAPVGGLHATTEDTTLGGYKIPKDTWVMINHWAIHFDERNWAEARKFKPEHFLDEAGEVRQHPNTYIPFSLGRRGCIGESFAKAKLFLLSTWLFQHYTFSRPTGEKGEFEIKLDTRSGIIHQPDGYEIVAKRRF